MNKIKVLNLYACLGGNRLKWQNCEVTAVELDPELAILYKARFPNDTVIIADAHQYLLDNYQNFDFIWSSPPCPSHSRARYWHSSNYNTATKAVYPDLKLYEEIIFLSNYFKGKYCVENVLPYYTPLIHGNKRGRHIYWTNFNIPTILGRDMGPARCKNEMQVLCNFHQYNFKDYKGKQKPIKIARNLVDYEAGKVIYETAFNILQQNNNKQGSLFIQ
jgi:DNA (cytosine-5)-methyltransferase 1